MSSRLVLGALGIAAACVVTLFVLFKDGDRSQQNEAVSAPGEEQGAAMPEQEAELRVPDRTDRDQRAPKQTPQEPPQVEQEAPEASELDRRELQLAKVEVFAFTLDGKPLAEALKDKLAGLQMSASLSTKPFGEWRLPQADPFVQGEGAGRAEADNFPRDDGQVARLALLADPPLWIALTLGPKVLSSQALNPEDESVEFFLNPEVVEQSLGSLQFQIIDGPSGAPVAESSVLVRSDLPNTFRSLSTDSEGFVRLDPWFAGPCEASVYGPESGWVTFELITNPGDPTDAGRIELWPGTSVEGLVVDDSGQPMKSVQVQTYPEGRSMPQYLATTDEAGRFSYTLADGVWFFRAYAQNDDGTLGFPLVRGEFSQDVAPRLVRIQQTRSAAFVLEASDAWARRATFRISIHNREAVQAGNLIHDSVWRTNLPLGPYDVELLGPDGAVMQRVEVDHGELGTRIVLDRL